MKEEKEQIETEGKEKMADPIEISMGRYYALKKKMQEEKKIEEMKTPARTNIVDPFESPEFDFSPPSVLKGNFSSFKRKPSNSSSSIISIPQSHSIPPPLIPIESSSSSPQENTVENASEEIARKEIKEKISSVQNVKENRENEREESPTNEEGAPFSAKKKCGTRQIPTSVKKVIQPSKIPMASSIKTPKKKGKKLTSKSPAVAAMKRSAFQKIQVENTEKRVEKRTERVEQVEEKISHIPNHSVSSSVLTFTPSSTSLQLILTESPVSPIVLKEEEEYEESKEDLKDVELSPIFAECGISPPKTPMFRSSQKNRLLNVINTPVASLEEGMKMLKLLEKEVMLLTPDNLPFSPPQIITTTAKKKQNHFPLDDDSFSSISPPKSVALIRSKSNFNTPAASTILPSILSLDSSPEISPGLIARYTRVAPTPAPDHSSRQVKVEEEERFNIQDNVQRLGENQIQFEEEDEMEEEESTALFSKYKLQEWKKSNQAKKTAETVRVKEETQAEEKEQRNQIEEEREVEEIVEEEVTALYSRPNLVMAPKYLLQQEKRGNTPVKKNFNLDEGEDFEEVEKTIVLDNSILHGRRTPRSSKFRNKAIKPSGIPRPFSAKKNSAKKFLFRPKMEEPTDSPLITRINILPVSRSRVARTPSPDRNSSDMLEAARTLNFSLQPSQKKNLFEKKKKKKKPPLL
eukprot:TRINITY_DN4126_c0_g1_i1.p1 TRINITY_DN4126_c0_g1~~TRINITY_DN4126_c0_g1_i1.p1  ORF type:complete len:691 (-),score=332.68 TRINITY_DN4126_c0_g1_i1:113-2185(-)